MIVLPRRLSDEVADRVRALIDEKNLEAGMKLPAERQLAMQLGVSRNSLREALAKLVSEGVLLSRRGGGNAKHLSAADVGPKGEIVPNTSGILGGVRVWSLDA